MGAIMELFGELSVLVLRYFILEKKWVIIQSIDVSMTRYKEEIRAWKI
jgi:hypothetical protein